MDTIEADINRPKFVVMVGTIASGKSTWSKKLQERLDNRPQSWIRLSSNLVKAEFSQLKNMDWDDIQSNPTLYLEYEDLLKLRIEEALQSGKNIVYDSTNIAPNKRKELLALVDASGKSYRKIAACMLIEPNEAVQRYVDRALENRDSQSMFGSVENQSHIKADRIERVSEFAVKLDQEGIMPSIEEGFDLVLKAPTREYRDRQLNEMLGSEGKSR